MSMKAFVLNCPIDLCSLDEALNKANDAIRNNINFQIITINPEMIMNAQKNEHFFNILSNSRKTLDSLRKMCYHITVLIHIEQLGAVRRNPSPISFYNNCFDKIASIINVSSMRIITM